MVKWLIVLSWLCGSGLALAAGQISIELPAGEQTYAAELGRAFTVQLNYRGEADLGRIPLDPWQADFSIARGYVRRTDDLQQLRLRLTPRRTGELTLPALQLGPASSEPQHVRVGPALEGDETLDPRWQLSTHRAWQGEELVASLQIDSRDPQLRLTTAEVRWTGLSHQALAMERLPLPDGRTRHRLHWLLRPLAHGEHAIAAPELRHLHEGVPKRRFHFPVEDLQVRALPDYLPPNLAIGGLSAEMDEQGRHWLVGHGITASQLQATLDHAHLSRQGLDEQRTAQGTRSRALLDWTGFEAAKARLVFFDPALGRLSQLDLAAPPAPVWAWLLALPVLLLAWLGWQRRRLGRWMKRILLRRRLLARLAISEAPHALKQTLTPEGQTLVEWQHDWQRDYRIPDGLADIVHRLSACCYGQQHDQGLSGDLRQVIARSRPRW